MIEKLTRQLGAGFMAGLRTRNASFLGILAISLGMPVLLLLTTATYLSQPFGWQLIIDIGAPFWVSVAFCLYLLSNKTLQVFHQQKEDQDDAPNLIRQFDIVVFALLIGLVASLVF